MKKSIYLGLIAIFLFSLASLHVILADSIAENYLSEFNNSGETCSITDFFVYDQLTPVWWDSNHYSNNVPVFYTCCLNQSCTGMVFDIKNLNFLDDASTKELYDLSYIKSNIQNGTIVKNQFITKGIDVCESFGDEKITQETANLASDTLKSATPLMNVETGQRITKTLTVAQKLGVIDQFNAGILVSSIACHYNNNLLKNAVENLALCNFYLMNIENNYAKAGYVYSLTNQVEITKLNLKSYLDSGLSMIRGSVNWLLNVFQALFSYSTKVNSGNTQFEIEKTEYQKAQEIYAQISSYNSILKNPNKESLLTGQKLRISEKTNDVQNEYGSFIMDYNNLSEMVPSSARIFFINVFFEPNYNFSSSLDSYYSSKQYKDLAEQFFQISKFNSAISAIDLAKINLTQSREIIIRESLIKRHFNLHGIIFLVIIVGIIIFLLKMFPKGYPIINQTSSGEFHKSSFH
jgi:hypothetical protein